RSHGDDAARARLYLPRVGIDRRVAGMGVAFARGRPAEQRGLSAPSRHLDLFAELEPAECRAFLARCTRQQFRAGANLFSQGEPYTRSYLIQSGVVRTYYVAPSGKEI